MALIASLLCFALFPLPAEKQPAGFKILTVDPGIYRVRYEDLAAKELFKQTIASDQLMLRTQGVITPIYLADGGDGTFDPGDYFEFHASVLRGEFGYYHEYTHTQAHFLTLDGEAPVSLHGEAPVSLNGEIPPRIGTQSITSKVDALLPSLGKGPAFRAQQHLEVDTLLMRFRSRNYEPHEIWYWHKLACNDAEPFAIPIETKDLDSHHSGVVNLKVGVRGWSQISGSSDLPDHVLHLYLNGKRIKETAWGGKDAFVIEVPNLPVSLWHDGMNELLLRIPARNDGQGQLVVDVTLLNWVEIDYPKAAFFRADVNGRFDIAPAFKNETLHLITPSQEPLFLYGENAMRWVLQPNKNPDNGPSTIHHLPRELTQTSFFATLAKDIQKPAAILALKPTDLRDPNRQIDYIMIAHPSLLEASKPLADFHQERGLNVKMVDIRDVYDTFNHGVIHPLAIRDFLKFASENWPKPAPRFVLLVGDASWDTKNATVLDQNYPDLTFYPRFRTEFNKILSTPYKNAEQNNRNLIPTLMFFDSTGHSASDNGLVCLDDDIKPDMAIGRLPVVEPKEVTGIVEKTINYMAEAQVGPWRRNILYITNEDRRFQRQTTALASKLADQGMVSQRIYPDSEEKSNEKHTKVILDALDQGQYMVYFLGHGGRYIWRTGPPDLNKNHDLFTLGDLDKLQSNQKLPIIVSLTCFSAPFDHPGADSIGEKFLRLDNKGAVAFFGASWRNWPNQKMAQTTMESLTEADTLGEAIQTSKQKINSPSLIQTYNLLGDPALPLRKPPATLALALETSGETVTVSFPVAANLRKGQCMLEVLNEAGEPLATETHTLSGKKMALTLPETDTPGHKLQIYLWKEKTGTDALGLIPLFEAPEEPQVKGRTRSHK